MSHGAGCGRQQPALLFAVCVAWCWQDDLVAAIRVMTHEPQQAVGAAAGSRTGRRRCALEWLLCMYEQLAPIPCDLHLQASAGKPLVAWWSRWPGLRPPAACGRMCLCWLTSGEALAAAPCDMLHVLQAGSRRAACMAWRCRVPGAVIVVPHGPATDTHARVGVSRVLVNAYLCDLCTAALYVWGLRLRACPEDASAQHVYICICMCVYGLPKRRW